jgi:hypothetical protein
MSLADSAGWALWLAATLFFAGHVHGRGGTGRISRYFALYLGAQAAVAAGALSDAPALCFTGMVVASAAYQLILIAALHADPSAAARGRAYAAGVGAVAAVLVVCVAAAYAAEVPVMAMAPVVYAHYAVGAAAAIATVARFCWRERADAAPACRTRLAPCARTLQMTPGQLALAGGLIGVADIWIAATTSHLLAHAADALLYVAPIVAALPALDAAYARTQVRSRAWARARACACGVALAVAAIAAAGAAFAFATLVSGNLCAWEPVQARGAPLCTSSPLSRVGAYGRAMHYLVRMSTTGSTAAREDARAVSLPLFDRPLDSLEPFPGAAPLRIAKEDEDGAAPSAADALAAALFRALKSPMLFPLEDAVTPWASTTAAHAALDLASGHAMPPPLTNWSGLDVASDAALAHMVFCGAAGWRLRAQPRDADGAVWSVDFAELAEFRVRPDFERFGATAFFDADRRPVRIHWAARALDVRPGDAAWPHAKFVWRSSVVVGITVTEHLIGNHLVIGNVVVMAARERLGKDHPLRRFLKPFNHLTPTINLGAMQFLTTEYSLLHRALAFTYDGLVGALRASMRSVRVRGAPLAHLDAMSAAAGGLPSFPFYEDGAALWRVEHAFVAAYFDIYWPDAAALRADESLARMWEGARIFGDASGLPPWARATRDDVIDALTAFVWHSTGGHHVFGNVAEFLRDPTFVTGRLRAGAEVADVEASHFALLVAILTGLPAPRLLNDFSHALLDDAHKAATRAVFASFQRNLTVLDADIAARNAVRAAAGTCTFDGFSPHRLLSSVSI